MIILSPFLKTLFLVGCITIAESMTFGRVSVKLNTEKHTHYLPFKKNKIDSYTLIPQWEFSSFMFLSFLCRKAFLIFTTENIIYQRV